MDTEVRYSPTGRYYLRESTRIRPDFGLWCCFTIHHASTGYLHSVHTRLYDALADLAEL